MPWVCASTPATLPPITPWPVRGPERTVESPGPSSGAATVTHYSDYDIAADLRESIQTQSYQSHGLAVHFLPAPEHRKAFSVFKKTRERLTEDAQQYFSQHTLPARPGTVATQRADAAGTVSARCQRKPAGGAGHRRRPTARRRARRF